MDQEWIKLMEEAKQMGISPEEVKEYIKKCKNEREKTNIRKEELTYLGNGRP